VDQDDGKITQAVDALLRDLIIPSKKIERFRKIK